MAAVTICCDFGAQENKICHLGINLICIKSCVKKATKLVKNIKEELNMYIYLYINMYCMFIGSKINIVKVSVLPNLIFIVNAIPIKSQQVNLWIVTDWFWSLYDGTKDPE